MSATLYVACVNSALSRVKPKLGGVGALYTLAEIKRDGPRVLNSYRFAVGAGTRTCFREATADETTAFSAQRRKGEVAK